MPLAGDILSFIVGMRQQSAQNEYMKAQSDLIKLNIKEKEQLEKIISTLSPEQQAAVRLNPEYAGLMLMFSKRGQTMGQQPDQGPQPDYEMEQGGITARGGQQGGIFAGGALPNQPIPQPLPDQIAQQQLGGMQEEQGLEGFLDQDTIIMGLLEKKLGVKVEKTKGIDGTPFGINGPVTVFHDVTGRKILHIMPESEPLQRIDVATPGGGTVSKFINPRGQSNIPSLPMQRPGGLPMEGMLKGPQEVTRGGISGGMQTKLDIMDTPISPEESSTWRHEDTGAMIEPGKIPSQAVKEGYHKITTGQVEKLTAIQIGGGVLQELEGLTTALWGGRDKIEKTFEERAKSRILGFTKRLPGALAQTYPEATNMKKFGRATLAPFVRLLGDVGNLSVGDIERAEGLVPEVTDTAEIAWIKVDQLKRLYKTIQGMVITGKIKPIGKTYLTKEQWNYIEGKTGGINLKPGAKETKILDGKTYIKKNGQWYEQ